MSAVRWLTATSLTMLCLWTPLAAPAVLDAQTGSRTSTQSSSQSANQTNTIEITGRVLNARTHQPIGRALVHFGARAVLTDHDGIFRFPGATSTSGSLFAAKPGFFDDSEALGGGSHSFQFTSAPIELLLYPEAILAGTVTNPSGESLPNLRVTARRSMFNETGHHWNQSGQTQTLSDGSFRLPVAAGNYSLQVSGLGRPTAGSEMILPVAVPANPTSINEAIHLEPGDEVHLDLRPEVRKAYEVIVTTDLDTDRGFPVLSARMANGLLLSVASGPGSREQRDQHKIALPAGSYTIVGVWQTPDGREQAEASVTVTDHGAPSVALHFDRMPVFPVEIEADISGNVNPPNPMQLGLIFNEAAASNEFGFEQSYTLTTRRNQSPAFSLPAGTYRLHTQGGGTWVITGASCGGSDLLDRDLTVAAGMTDTPIRIRVSNKTASVSGTVKLKGAPGAAWVYLIATTPSASPVQSFRSNQDGSFQRGNLAPGNYRVLALENRVSADLQNNQTVNRYLDRLQSVSVAAGDQQTVTLDAVPAAELAQ